MVSISKMVQSGYRLIQYLLLYLLWQLGTISFGWAEHSSVGIQQKTESYSLGKWRWAEDNIAPLDDKQVHAVGSFGLYYLFTEKGIHPNKAAILISSLGLAKECVDALVPWEIYGRIGGDGFSKYDMLYNALGLFTAYVIDERWVVSYRNGHINIIYTP
tara:strand:- start:91 stop:567 length:477 start_codon:yes stop_codon:yes gene_type:complete